LQADRIEASTGYNIAAVQYQLDRTLDMLDNHVIQRATVDPGESYAGLIITDKLKAGNPPYELHLDVDWNGERYPFAYVLERPGKAIPERYNAMLAAKAKPKLASAPFSAPAAPQASPGRTRALSARTVVQVAQKDPDGAIYLRSGAVKIPANTASGYCIKAPDDYMGTGSIDYPVITSGMPRCNESGKYPRQSSFLPDPKRF
jgi:hypothetical protein